MAADGDGGFVLDSRSCPTDVFEGTYKLEYSVAGTNWQCQSSTDSSVTITMANLQQIKLNSCFTGTTSYCELINKFMEITSNYFT